MSSNNNVFSGTQSVLDYLNPDNNPYIPLVELPDSLNPFRRHRVRIFAKLMNALPLTNVKSLPAYHMLQKASQRGALEGIDTIIENSSGNTVLSLAVIARLMGISHTKAVVSNEVSPGKLNMLRLFGTEVIVNKEAICPDPNDKESGIYKSKVWAKERGWFNAGQYDNRDNPESHKRWTGKQIWEQTDGKISVFCAGLGTTGTMVGTGAYLKEHGKHVQNVGVVRVINNPVPGPRTQQLLREIAFDWCGVVDHVEEVGTVDSYRTSVELCRAGLVVGPSSGFNLKGLYLYLQEHIEKGTLDTLRNEDGEVVSVFIACDTPLPYLDEYFEYLDESDFPQIENEELLNHTGDDTKNSIKMMDISKYEVDVKTAFEMTFKDGKSIVWDHIERGVLPRVHSDIIIIDTRNQASFDHFHIPTSVHMGLEYLEKHIEAVADEYRGKRVITVCHQGISSQRSTWLLRNQKIEAFSMIGGMSEWSRLQFPRWRPENCRIHFPHDGAITP